MAESIPIAKKTSGGRRKIPMKKIDDPQRLRVAFSKRRKSLFGKAEQLKVLCGVEVGVIVQYPGGKICASGDESQMYSLINRYLSAAAPGTSRSGTVTGGDAFISSGRDRQFQESKGLIVNDPRPSYSSGQGFNWGFGTSSGGVFAGASTSGCDFPVIERTESGTGDFMGLIPTDRRPGFNAGGGLPLECGTFSSVSIGGGFTDGGFTGGASIGGLERTESVTGDYKGLMITDQRPICNVDQGFAPINYEDFNWLEEWMEKPHSFTEILTPSLF